MKTVKINNIDYALKFVAPDSIPIPRQYKKIFKERIKFGIVADFNPKNKIIRLTRSATMTKKHMYENLIHEIIHGILFENKKQLPFVYLTLQQEEEVVELITQQLIDALFSLTINHEKLSLPKFY